jgi:S-adenosylmethionine uptake transporter
MIKGVAAGFLAYALFSSSDACVKALGPGMSVFEIIFLITLASLCTFAFAKPASERWREVFHIHRPGLVFIRAAAGVLGSLAGAYAFTTLPLAEAYSLLFLMPAFATLLAISVLGDHVGGRRGIAIFCGFVGVVLVVRPGFHELHLGHLAAAFAAVAAAVAMITLRLLGRSERRISLLATLYLSMLVVNGTLMLFRFIVPDLRQIGLAVFAGLVSGVGQISMLAATRNAPPNRVAPTQYSQMIWAVVFGATFFGEIPDAVAFLGMVLIVASGLFTFLREEQLYGWSRRIVLVRNRD